MDRGLRVGEVVRRVDGRSLTRFVADQLTGPCDADLQIGARASDRARTAPIVAPPPRDIDLFSTAPASPAVRTFLGPLPDPAAANTPGLRRAEIDAAAGHATVLGL